MTRTVPVEHAVWTSEPTKADDVASYVRQSDLAEHDLLTGLVSRATLRSRLAGRLAQARPAGQPTAILYMDLHRFKDINTTLGHPAGDALLRRVAERLRRSLCKSDVVARFGGDEFAIIQSDAVQPGAAIALATRLIDLIGRTYAIDGKILHIGASVGIAMALDHERDPDVILKNAALALHHAKTDGRRCYRLFEAYMEQRMQARRSLEVDLRRAIALKELKLVYQPQLSLVTGKVIGFEALISWQHPVHGNFSSADIIPLAEEIGVIAPIGEWVLRTACAEAAKWPAPLPVSVNVSLAQIRGGKLSATILAALEHAGLVADRLELEITEGALLDGTDTALNVLQGLRKLGVGIVLDDFGTGYSSLSYLRQFGFAKIKIDQSFVRDINKHPENRALLGSVLRHAAKLGMKSVAEGVENEAELACLRSEGCDEVQGVLTGRPLSSDAVFDLLRPLAQGAFERTAM